MKFLILATSISLLIALQNNCAADIIAYADVDDDGWGDTPHSITLSDPYVPLGFVRLSHDPDDTEPGVFPNNGPSLAFNSGFYNAVVGQPLSFSVTMSGATNVEFFDTVLPNLATFDPGALGTSITGTFTWTPDSSDVGFHGFETYGRFVGGSAEQISGTYATIEVSAVPEPSSAALLFLGFCCVAYSRRSCRKYFG